MRLKTLRFCLLAVLLGGCVPIASLHPLFTKETIVFDEKLVGTWVEDSNDSETTWEFTRFDENAALGILELYRNDVAKFCHLTITGKDGGKGSFAACLVKLGDHLFLDVFADQFPSGEQEPEKMKLAYNAFFFQPLHMVFKVDSLGDPLKIRMTDDEEFQKLMEAEPKAVEFTVVEKRPILTAETKDLQAFVTKYAGDERLFPNDLTLTRKTKTPSP